MSTQPPAHIATNPPGETAPNGLANLNDLTDVDELAGVLIVLEDFLLHADSYIVDELAGYPLTRPDDPQAWVSWIADLLGEHVITLRALIPTATATLIATNQALPAHQMIGEPR